MINTIFKYLFIFSECIYIYNQILSIKHSKKFEIIVIPCISIILAIFTYMLKLFIPCFMNILPLLIIWLFQTLFFLKPQISFITTLFSFGISYGISIFSNIIVSVILSPFRFYLSNTPFFDSILITGILSFVIIILLFRIKRFRRGMPFLYSEKFINIGTKYVYSSLQYLLTFNWHLFPYFFHIYHIHFFSLSPLPPSSSGGRHSLPSPTSTSCSFWSWNLCARNWRKPRRKWNI